MHISGRNSGLPCSTTLIQGSLESLGNKLSSGITVNQARRWTKAYRSHTHLQNFQISLLPLNIHNFAIHHQIQTGQSSNESWGLSLAAYSDFHANRTMSQLQMAPKHVSGLQMHKIPVFSAACFLSLNCDISTPRHRSSSSKLYGD